MTAETVKVVVVQVPSIEGLHVIAQDPLQNKQLEAFFDRAIGKWSITQREIEHALRGRSVALRHWANYFDTQKKDEVLFPNWACRPVVNDPAGVP